MVLKLANSFTKKRNVRKLAEQELGVQRSVVDHHLQNSQNGIPEAMFNILQKWNTFHPHTAYVYLCRALKRAKMDRLIIEVMGGVPENFEEGKMPLDFLI